jgi:hypothetical protein
MLRQQGQRLRIDFSNLLSFKFGDGDVIAGEQIILGIILLRGKGS